MKRASHPPEIRTEVNRLPLKSTDFHVKHKGLLPHLIRDLHLSPILMTLFDSSTLSYQSFAAYPRTPHRNFDIS
jgi:hypothetical protein